MAGIQNYQITKMRQTNVLKFVLKERAYLSTKLFESEAIPWNSEPGDTLLVTVDPIGALLSERFDRAYQDGGKWKEKKATAPYATTLAVTISRFRKFRYIGTRIGLRPAATTGTVDIAHITQPVGGGSNYVHPYDISNMLHFRRWVGGNIDLPHINVGTHVHTDAQDHTADSGYWTVKQSMDLDLAWMSDPRFMHVNVSQGFDLFARPMRATVETAPEGATTLWLYGNINDVGAQKTFTDAAASSHKRPLGRTALTGGRIVPDGWTSNPLSCFKYSTLGETDVQAIELGEDKNNAPSTNYVQIYDIQRRAPWFMDYFDTDGFTGEVSDAFRMVRERYLNPVCILRIPPAYGTVMYYTMYIAHYFAVAQPYLTNTAYVAAHIDSITPKPMDPITNQTLAFNSIPGLTLQPSRFQVHQAVCPDPMSAAETGYTADFATLHGLQYVQAVRMNGTDEPTDGMDEMADAFAEFGMQDDIPSTAAIPPEAPAAGGAGESQGGVDEDDS